MANVEVGEALIHHVRAKLVHVQAIPELGERRCVGSTANSNVLHQVIPPCHPSDKIGKVAIQLAMSQWRTFNGTRCYRHATVNTPLVPSSVTVKVSPEATN